MEAILNFIKDLLGDSAFVGFVAVVVLVFLVWWARGIKEKMSKVDFHENYMNEFRDAVARISNLPCAAHTHEIERYNTENHDMNTRITKVETSIEYLQRSLDTFTKNKLILDKFTESHSPLSISEEGRKMMERLGIQKMFEENWERIKKLIDEGVIDKNPYDIDLFCQEQSVVFPEKFLKKNQVDMLKADAYSEGLSLTSYMRVIAILSRDKYLETYTETTK